MFRISHVARCWASPEAKGRCWSCRYRTIPLKLSNVMALTTVGDSDREVQLEQNYVDRPP